MVLGCPPDARSGGKSNQSARETGGEGVGLRDLYGTHAAVVDRGEPPAFGTSYGDNGVPGKSALRELRSPSNKDRASAMQYGDIVGDVPNGLDLADERRTKQHAAEQLVMRLDHLITPMGTRSVE